ncbi:MAG: PilZ domain-containing protein [Candidatus Methylomirabilales bacterium]
MQRQFTRFPLVLPLQHRVPGHPLSGAAVGWTHNLSGGGACLELAEPLQPQLSLGLRLQTSGGPIEAEARVVWTRNPRPAEGGSLHGIAFTQLAPDHLEVLRRLLLSLQPWRRTQVRFPVDLAVICQPQRPPGPLYSSRVSDISRGGLALRLPEVLLPFTALDVTLPTPAGRLSLAGEIAWVDRPEGRRRGRLIRHGMRFARLDWSTALVLARLLAEALNSPQLSSPEVRTTPR